jgi:hypothetical protein
MRNSWLDTYGVRYLGRSVFNAITDYITDTQSAITVLSITVTAELGAFAMLYVSKDKVIDFLESGDNAFVYAYIGVFLAGFFTTFAASGLVPDKFRRRISKFAIWVVSIAAGLANIALFFVLINFQMR